jgi:RNA recognition motif-containing protein
LYLLQIKPIFRVRWKNHDKIICRRIATDIEEIELVQLLAIYGEVLTVKIVRDRLTKNCKGYGFLEIANIDAAENVIRFMDGKPIGKKNNLIINLVKGKALITPTERYSPKSPPIYERVTNEATSKKKRPRMNR